MVMWLFCIFLVINSPPKLKDLYNLIKPDYAAHWKVVGALLGIEKGILVGIERNFPNNVSWCCNELLKTWLERDICASWKKIIEVIDSSVVTALVTSSSAAVVSPQVLSGNYLHSYKITNLTRAETTVYIRTNLELHIFEYHKILRSPYELSISFPSNFEMQRHHLCTNSRMPTWRFSKITQLSFQSRPSNSDVVFNCQ